MIQVEKIPTTPSHRPELISIQASLTKAFLKLDKDNNGYLTYIQLSQLQSQVRSSMFLCDIDQATLEKVTNILDPKSTSKIQLPELIAHSKRIILILGKPGEKTETLIKKTFYDFDTSNTGTLDRGEFRLLVNLICDMMSVERLEGWELTLLINQMDDDLNQQVDSKELINNYLIIAEHLQKNKPLATKTAPNLQAEIIYCRQISLSDPDFIVNFLQDFNAFKSKLPKKPKKKETNRRVSMLKEFGNLSSKIHVPLTSLIDQENIKTNKKKNLKQSETINDSSVSKSLSNINNIEEQEQEDSVASSKSPSNVVPNDGKTSISGKIKKQNLFAENTNAHKIFSTIEECGEGKDFNEIFGCLNITEMKKMITEVCNQKTVFEAYFVNILNFSNNFKDFLENKIDLDALESQNNQYKKLIRLIDNSNIKIKKTYDDRTKLIKVKSCRGKFSQTESKYDMLKDYKQKQKPANLSDIKTFLNKEKSSGKGNYMLIDPILNSSPVKINYPKYNTSTEKKKKMDSCDDQSKNDTTTITIPSNMINIDHQSHLPILRQKFLSRMGSQTDKDTFNEKPSEINQSYGGSSNIKKIVNNMLTNSPDKKQVSFNHDNLNPVIGSPTKAFRQLDFNSKKRTPLLKPTSNEISFYLKSDIATVIKNTNASPTRTSNFFSFIKRYCIT